MALWFARLIQPKGVGGGGETVRPQHRAELLTKCKRSAAAPTTANEYGKLKGELVRLQKKTQDSSSYHL